MVNDKDELELDDEEEIIKVRRIKNPGLEDYYISRDGEIFNKDFKMRKSTIKNGYYNITLNGNMHAVHRLVALTYIKNPNNHPVVNHIDENKVNNNVKNLEWVTQKENCNAHKKKISHERRVIQKDLEDNFVAVHESVTKAGESIGLTRHAINKVCIGKNKTAGNYKWEYEDPSYKYVENVDLSTAKLITNFANYYIFPTGEIYNTQRKAYLKHCINADGAHYVSFSSSREKLNRYVNNLVGTYFIDNPNNCKNVVHIDGDKDNNNVDNLEWK
jgi:hypothetical protein